MFIYHFAFCGLHMGGQKTPLVKYVALLRFTLTSSKSHPGLVCVSQLAPVRRPRRPHCISHFVGQPHHDGFPGASRTNFIDVNIVTLVRNKCQPVPIR